MIGVCEVELEAHHRCVSGAAMCQVKQIGEVDAGSIIGWAFIFNSGRWTLNGLLMAKIGTWERILMRQMLGRNKAEGETWHDFNMRVPWWHEGTGKSRRALQLSAVVWVRNS